MSRFKTFAHIIQPILKKEEGMAHLAALALRASVHETYRWQVGHFFERYAALKSVDLPSDCLLIYSESKSAFWRSSKLVFINLHYRNAELLGQLPSFAFLPDIRNLIGSRIRDVHELVRKPLALFSVLCVENYNRSTLRLLW